MDLMTASTSYSRLQNKYRNFAAPTVRVHVDGVEIIEKLNAKLSAVTVELTAGFSASGCSFDVIDEYEPKNTAFSTKGAAMLLQLGAKVELELGYIETVSVFYGLIAEVEYVFDDEDSAPYIHVECMDAKCLLMKQQRLMLLSGKSVTDAVGDMLSAQPFSAYIKGKEVDASKEKIDIIPVAMEDDYQFAVRWAQYIDYEFFIIQGKAYYRKTPTSSSSVMTLRPDAGLLSAQLSLRGDSLYKKTLVVGINPEDDKMVKGEAAVKGRFGKGGGSAQMMGASVKTHFDYNVHSAGAAAARAKTLMRSAQGQFGRLYCRCIGIPELAPGRNVKIKGVSPQADTQCYIMDIRHSFDERGFFTTLEARIDKL